MINVSKVNDQVHRITEIYKLKMGSITKTRGPSDISPKQQHSYLLEQEDAPVNLTSDNQVSE